MTINEVCNMVTEKYPGRKPARYAQDDVTWYVYTENIVNNGKHLNTLIENGWFAVTDAGVMPTTPLDMPNGLKFKIIHGYP